MTKTCFFFFRNPLKVSSVRCSTSLSTSLQSFSGGGGGGGSFGLDKTKKKLCQYQVALYTKIKHTICTYSFINATILSAVLSFTSKANSPSLIIKTISQILCQFFPNQTRELTLQVSTQTQM